MRTHVLVSGRVQGVSFRWTCARRAKAEGVRGWVRNLECGQVEAVFEGEPEAVAAMVAWCKEGPPHAVVIDVQAVDEPPAGETAFRVTTGG